MTTPPTRQVWLHRLAYFTVLGAPPIAADLAWGLHRGWLSLDATSLPLAWQVFMASVLAGVPLGVLIETLIASWIVRGEHRGWKGLYFYPTTAALSFTCMAVAIAVCDAYVGGA